MSSFCVGVILWGTKVEIPLFLTLVPTVMEFLPRPNIFPQIAVQKVDAELAQTHMVQWVENKVMEQITPETVSYYRTTPVIRP